MSKGQDSTEQKEGKEKKITVGATLTLSSSVTILLVRGDARKELDKYSGETRQQILDEAIEISKKRGHSFDVRAEDVLEAIKTRGVRLE